MYILNVDDDADDREMFCMALNKINPSIQCVQMDSGEEAVRFFSAKSLAPDFIFIDINMPRMNGYECVKLISQNINLKHTGIVMYSSSFYNQDKVDFGLLGIQYLLKTSSLKDLTDSIEKIISPKLLEEKLKM